MAGARTRTMAIVAQDPAVRDGDGRVLTASVTVPWESLERGPVGHRVHVIDYDASTKRMYRPASVDDAATAVPKTTRELLGDPEFHARNVYALVMRTLGRFEYALGRRVGWGFPAHQLKVVPHAFEEMNAFYSRDAQSLVFGYYRTEDGVAFTCLSHDVVVHETSHALLDGLRYRFMAPSSPDQAAFHEAFGDIVALLSVFSLSEVLQELLERGRDAGDATEKPPKGLIAKDRVTADGLMDSVLLGLAEEMADASGSPRTGALRRSVRIEPDEHILDRLEYREAHRRGEILVAAVMRAFVDAWTRRLASLGTIEGDHLDLGRVAEEGATIADVLLTMAIRAIDYTPPIHIEFGDYLSALVTADAEIRSDDSRYGLQKGLLDWFGRYGIKPASGTPDGLWVPPKGQLRYDGVRFQSLQTDPIEMFSLLWANRRRLHLDASAYTRVASLRPCVRTSPEDGLPLRETVAECTQYVKIPARDLGDFGLTAPAGMPTDLELTLEGGSTLILDEYGRLKYEIHNRLPAKGDPDDQASAQARLEYLWDHGAFDKGASINARLATLHRQRLGVAGSDDRDEVW
jgi:hypothetical protein